VLVNNAGVGLAAPFEATTPAELRHLLEVNLVGVLVATQAALRHMRAAGHGHIVNVGSIVGRRGTAFRAAYAATKFGLVGLTEALRLELRHTGISVSLVYPVVTDTEFARAEVRKVEPVRRGPVQSAERVARAIVACVRRPRAEVYPYPPARVLAVLSALAPSLVDRMMARVAGHTPLSSGTVH
jgi:short-subunit dehydrogenase